MRCAAGSAIERMTTQLRPHTPRHSAACASVCTTIVVRAAKADRKQPPRGPVAVKERPVELEVRGGGVHEAAPAQARDEPDEARVGARRALHEDVGVDRAQQAANQARAPGSRRRPRQHDDIDAVDAARHAAGNVEDDQGDAPAACVQGAREQDELRLRAARRARGRRAAAPRTA